MCIDVALRPAVRPRVATVLLAVAVVVTVAAFVLVAFIVMATTALTCGRLLALAVRLAIFTAFHVAAFALLVARDRGTGQGECKAGCCENDSLAHCVVLRCACPFVQHARNMRSDHLRHPGCIGKVAVSQSGIGSGYGANGWIMNRRQIIVGIYLTLQGFVFWAGAVVADDKTEKARRATQQDQILEAVKRGEIRPLLDIQAAAEKAVPGQIVGVEIERRKGRLVYEFKIIAAGGRVREVYVDAATLDIVKVE